MADLSEAEFLLLYVWADEILLPDRIKKGAPIRILPVWLIKFNVFQ